MSLIIDKIKEYVKNYPELKKTETVWREPVVGIADVANPLFLELNKVASPTHVLPGDFISGAKSVIVFFLPFAEEIIKSNVFGFQSSRAWDIANIETNNLIADLNIFLHEVVTKEGYDSTILPATYNYDEKKLTSDWSHRHVAYIAGVGTFGINNMLITERGCCGRIGSVITTMPLEATETLKGENCLYKHNSSCAQCVKRCVASAISIEEGYPYVNRVACNEQVYDGLVPEYDIGPGDACGKCMCQVPCTMKNPCAKFQKFSEGASVI